MDSDRRPKDWHRAFPGLLFLLALVTLAAGCQSTDHVPAPDAGPAAPQAQAEVVSFSLIDADSDQVVSGYEVIADGAVIDYAAIGTQNLSIRANTSPSTVGSVVFNLDGVDVRVENQVPYAIAGDSAGGADFLAISPPLQAGAHTLIGTPSTKKNGQGTVGLALTVGFEIAAGDPDADFSPVAVDDSYGVVSGGVLTVDAPGVLANDSDPEGAPLVAVLVSPPAYGSFTFGADGSFTYGHDGSAATSDSFTYAVSDGVNTSAPAVVAIDLAAPTSEVVSFSLIDADSDQVVSGYEVIADGAVIDYAAIGTQNLSIRANTSPSTVGSVVFNLDGVDVRVETVPPYAIAGDESDGNDYLPISPPLASDVYNITATPYSKDNAQGTAGVSLSLDVQIIASAVSETGCTPSPSQFPGMKISPLECEVVKVFDPFVLEWDEGEGGVLDRHGIGSGFTMILPATKGSGYLPSNAVVDIATGSLGVTSTKGLKYTTSNSQDNALGVGLDLPNKTLRLATTIMAPGAGTGKFEQAGLWFGISEDDYIKLAVISTPEGFAIQALKEELGSFAGDAISYVSLPLSSVTLSLVADPVTESVLALYRLGSGPESLLTRFDSVPSAWFSKDAAGIDLTVGTRSYGGIFTSHRNALAALRYDFADFAVTEDSGVPEPPPPSSDTTIDFDTWRFDGIDFPSGLAWGPDDRLYVTHVGGPIYAVTLDHDARAVVDIQTFPVLGSRTVLGISVDPESTAEDVVLWVSHSSDSLSAGEANSGVVSRLSGPDFSVREDIITGLPRAIANHAPNALHFGPDGRLYIAVGGNTGAGASNDGNSEFGPRPEQPLSAALLVADVKAPLFDGSCRSAIDPDGSQMDATGISATDVPCDVQVHASGLRNAYDFTFHSNGGLYATDNGLGVEGTIPALSPDDLSWAVGDGCEGMVNGQEERDARNPGPRSDLLHRVAPGDYFGHPNPSRGECIFFGANPTSSLDFPVPTSAGEPQVYMEASIYQDGLQPDVLWKQPLFALGKSKSANGIIAYEADTFCGPLKGDLLITYYSTGDQIRRVRLSDDGHSVVGDETLVRSTTGTGGIALANPLPIAQDPLGRVYIGEFGNGGTVAVLDPVGPGCWQSDGVSDVPEAILDAGGTALHDDLFMVAGKTSGGPQRTLWRFSSMRNRWTRGADLPLQYPAVENPAVVSYGGRLYSFGGSTDPFTGATSSAARYDPATDSWTMLSPMPTARGGASAQVIDDMLYVVGGMDDTGTSLASIDAYDPTTDAWVSTLPAMHTPRDNPGSAAIAGKLYVFGGRTRNSTSSPNDPTLATVEVYDPASNAWGTAAPMPTGRRTMNVVVVDDRAVVMGGEEGVGGSSFASNEEYDPSTDTWVLLPPMPAGRHGAVAGRIGNGIFVAGGGPTGGSSFTVDVDVFRYR